MAKLPFQPQPRYWNLNSSEKKVVDLFFFFLYNHWILSRSGNIYSLEYAPSWHFYLNSTWNTEAIFFRIESYPYFWKTPNPAAGNFIKRGLEWKLQTGSNGTIPRPGKYARGCLYPTWIKSVVAHTEGSTLDYGRGTKQILGPARYTQKVSQCELQHLLTRNFGYVMAAGRRKVWASP